MKNVINVLLGIAGISLVLSIFSRLTMIRIPIAPGGGIEAEVLLAFTNTCLLAAIAVGILGLTKK